ncbi:GNAT family N-acetyltransferase [Pedobacter steynii]|uniref:GNAT family N-acetyltransferase n=1 Tax=Pedobacter steynii TaxID=430522 RepID=UPI0009F57D22|nr:GNAT family N-acetyltransferase [Pedobacter steynii]
MNTDTNENQVQDQVSLLDRPIWNALNSKHASFALGNEYAKRYPSQILPFIGFDLDSEQPLEQLKAWMKPNEIVYAIGDLPKIPDSWQLLNQLDCVQMFCPELSVSTLDESIEILTLKEEDRAEMFELITSVQPGYFAKDTPLLGHYNGIRVNGKLISMSGERLGLDSFTELSAVCTHPDFTGKGLAYQLVLKTCLDMFERGTKPFLHVLNSNTRAINLYERLGFVKRKDIAFNQLKSL